MGKSKVVDRESKMCIQTSEKDSEGRVTKKFKAASNFTFKPVHQVMGAKDGYIMRVTTFPHNVNINAFVPSNPKLDVFVNHLNKALRGNAAGGLVCSLSEHMFKNELVRKINKFLNGKRYSLLFVTDVLGKIPTEYHEQGDVFVLSDEVQITGEGVLIPANEREFTFLPDDRHLRASIQTPLSIEPFKSAISTMELALKHNFAATMFTMGCFAMTIHADAVRKLDGSPTVVLVGPAGRGKTTALQLAMACAGIQDIGFIKTATKEKILQRASQCTLGVFLDDPPNISSLKELFIDFFNGASRETISRGHEKIRCGLMITSNETVSGSARELRRLVYIPFLGPSVRGATANEVSAHVQIKKMINQGYFSSAIASFVRMGSTFLREGMDEIASDLIPWVTPRLNGCLPDSILPYATAMWFSQRISSELFGDNHKKIHDKFFEETVAPFAIANQPGEILNEVGGDDKDVPKALNVLETFKKDLKEFIIQTPISEVLKTVKMGTSKGTDCLVIMPGFYQGKDYNPDNLHSHLKRSNLGGSQARKPNPASKSVRTTLLSLNAFNDEERDCLEKALTPSKDGTCEQSLPEKSNSDGIAVTKEMQESTHKLVDDEDVVDARRPGDNLANSPKDTIFADTASEMNVVEGEVKEPTLFRVKKDLHAWKRKRSMGGFPKRAKTGVSGKKSKKARLLFSYDDNW